MTIPEDFTEAMQRSDDANPVLRADINRRVVVMALRQLARIEAEHNTANDWMIAIMSVHRAEAEARDAERERLTVVVEEIAKEMLPPDSKHVDIPGMARISMRATPEYLRVADPDAFIAWAKTAERPELVKTRTVETVDTALAKEIAAEARNETGEILPGIEVVPEKVTMSIQSAVK